MKLNRPLILQLLLLFRPLHTAYLFCVSEGGKKSAGALQRWECMAGSSRLMGNLSSSWDNEIVTCLPLGFLASRYEGWCTLSKILLQPATGNFLLYSWEREASGFSTGTSPLLMLLVTLNQSAISDCISSLKWYWKSIEQEFLSLFLPSGACLRI